MRRILIDYARYRRRVRHGGVQERVPLDGAEIASPPEDEPLLEVDEVLDELAAQDIPSLLPSASTSSQKCAELRCFQNTASPM